MKDTTHTTASLSYQFTDAQALKNAFMPFVRDGGIFIPTEQRFHLGDSVIATIDLPNKKTFTFKAEVVWITPKSAHGNTRCGVGVQCSGDEGEAFRKAARELMDQIKEEVKFSDTM